MQRALDLLAVAEFGLVVVAIAKFRQVGRAGGRRIPQSIKFSVHTAVT